MRPWKAEDSVVFQGLPNVSNIQLRWYPYEALKSISSLAWPTTIELHEEPIEGIPTSFSKTSFSRFTWLAMKPTFVDYYERVKLQVIGKYGRACQNWPSVWNFGRIIRNAISHGGIHFDNKRAAPVGWRGLVFDPADEGHQITRSAGLSVVEFILLMDEMDHAV